MGKGKRGVPYHLTRSVPDWSDAGRAPTSGSSCGGGAESGVFSSGSLCVPEGAEAEEPSPVSGPSCLLASDWEDDGDDGDGGAAAAAADGVASGAVAAGSEEDASTTAEVAATGAVGAGCDDGAAELTGSGVVTGVDSTGESAMVAVETSAVSGLMVLVAGSARIVERVETSALFWSCLLAKVSLVYCLLTNSLPIEPMPARCW